MPHVAGAPAQVWLQYGSPLERNWKPHPAHFRSLAVSPLTGPPASADAEVLARLSGFPA